MYVLHSALLIFNQHVARLLSIYLDSINKWFHFNINYLLLILRIATDPSLHYSNISPMRLHAKKPSYIQASRNNTPSHIYNINSPRHLDLVLLQHLYLRKTSRRYRFRSFESILLHTMFGGKQNWICTRTHFNDLSLWVFVCYATTVSVIWCGTQQ